MSFSRIVRRALLAALVLGVASAAAAQPQRRNAADRQARLVESLDLSAAQAALVQEALGDNAHPGALWTLAAALAPTLSDAQKERLFTRPERTERGRMRRGEGRRERSQSERPRRERPERSDADREARRAALQEHQADMRAAMIEALDLSPRQVEQLDALREEHRARREARRAERRAQREAGERPARTATTRRSAPGRIPAELAEILNADQQEVWAVHQALAIRMRHRGARPRRGH